MSLSENEAQPIRACVRHLLFINNNNNELFYSFSKNMVYCGDSALVKRKIEVAHIRCRGKSSWIVFHLLITRRVARACSFEKHIYLSYAYSLVWVLRMFLTLFLTLMIFFFYKLCFENYFSNRGSQQSETASGAGSSSQPTRTTQSSSSRARVSDLPFKVLIQCLGFLYTVFIIFGC